VNEGVNRTVNPASIAPPAAAYSHGVVSSGAAAMLHTAGVVPIAPDGSVPEGLSAQAALVWSNIEAILAEAGFVVSDIVSITTYVVAGSNLAMVMEARDAVMKGHRPASTLVYVPALARPQWLVEVSVVAAH
jgi:enamine deaminase RidA (YjgF/YER057c/UK114 family)